MDIELFDYDLPADLIAQEPLADRAASRLMRLRRDGAGVEHRGVRDLPDILRRGDLLVFNDTAVVPAKLRLRRATGSRIDGLFLHQADGGRWTVLLKSRGRLRPGERLAADGHESVGVTLVNFTDGQWEVEVRDDESNEVSQGEGTLRLLRRIGHTPLPPYIRRPQDRTQDETRYQTVFARRPGAVAAPTAGLHFTNELLCRLAEAGIERAFVTLHVGLGTFEPLRRELVEQHRMHSEWFTCPPETAAAVNAARSAGRRVIAVGTTSVRVLESCWQDGAAAPISGWTDLFVYPGYRFRTIDGLLTNFHLPRSSLLLLVSAWAGRERLLSAYAQAVAMRYRFFSYGDAMLID